ncbi:hypothetical protein MIR68_002311 [Amoeboaphelidium protococcarum]|nr:hypothetical protein MIR68_002311 [Amoeboaphelidium protococcarum]
MEYNFAGVAVLWTLLGLVVLGIVWYYADRRTEWFVYVSTFIGWLFPFSTVLLLPVDLTSTMYNHCQYGDTNRTTDAINVTSFEGNQTTPQCQKPVLYVSDDFLWAAWRSIYWTMFLLTFVIVPLIQAFCDSGYFSAYERFKKAVRVNVIYYVVIGGLGIVGIIILWTTGGINDPNALLNLAMTAANLFGLSLVILLLSNGLIEVPRSLWHSGNRARMLRYMEFQAPKIKDQLNDAQVEYNDLLKEIKAIAAKTRFHDDNRKYVDVVMSQVETDAAVESSFVNNNSDQSDSQNQYGGNDDQHSLGSPLEVSVTDMVTLARLNKEIKRARREKERCEYEWNELCEQAFFLQDILGGRIHPNSRWRLPASAPVALHQFSQKLQYFWYCIVSSYVLRLAALVFGAVSLIIVWSELVYVVPNIVLSIVGLIFNNAGVSYATVEWFSCIFMLYMLACCIYSLFKVKIFNMYALHPNHHSSDVSMCWFTSQMCRITFPLCYNFMAMAIGSDQDTLFYGRQPIFSQLMGKMKLEGLQFYVPILVSVVTGLNLFNVIGRLAKCFGFSDDLFSTTTDNNSSDGSGGGDSWGDVEDGRILLADARAKMERSGSRSALNDITISPSNGQDRQRLLNKNGDKQTNSSAFTESRLQVGGGSSRRNPDAPLSEYKANNPIYQKYLNKK